MVVDPPKMEPLAEPPPKMEPLLLAAAPPNTEDPELPLPPNIEPPAELVGAAAAVPPNGEAAEVELPLKYVQRKVQCCVPISISISKFC